MSECQKCKRTINREGRTIMTTLCDACSQNFLEQPKCELCGEPMPPGEEMFKLHGYSGPCPKPPLPKETPVDPRDAQIASLTAEVERLKADNAKLLALDRAIRVMNLNRTEPAALVAEVERLRAGILAAMADIDAKFFETPDGVLKAYHRLAALLQPESNDGK